jgi:hypothetical protein
MRGDLKEEERMTTHDSELDYDWGGDGSDLNEPIRAHVEAALVPTTADYPPPLDQLLRLGDARPQAAEEAKLAALGLTQEHVPDLVRMARDRALNITMSDTDEIWAPIHAVEALKQFDASAFITELIPLFDVDSDWFSEAVPEILGNTGEVALEPLHQYMQDHTRWIYGRAHAASALTKIAQKQPDLRARVLQFFNDELANSGENDPALNGFFLSDLLSLQASEMLPAIRRAFEADDIDESIAGDWASVMEDFGQVPDPADPLVLRSRERSDMLHARMFLPSARPAAELGSDALPSIAPKKSHASKHKNKRKLSGASRKANKGKKKRK